jgi:hypothetical protein
MEAFAALGVDLVEVIRRSADPVGNVSRLTETVVPRLTEIG